jgi:catechol 2,3-dioxygenase-like lactoylglutathione lyase family enzyme
MAAEEVPMFKLDHLAIPVRDRATSRDWYVGKLGLKVEFEVTERRTVAVADQNDFTIFLVEDPAAEPSAVLAFWYQVDDVRAAFDELSRKGVAFNHGPQKNFWGFGAEARDPDGYAVRLWDERSMKAES